MKKYADLLKSFKSPIYWAHYVVTLLAMILVACFGQVKGREQLVYLVCLIATFFVAAVAAHSLWLSPRRLLPARSRAPKRRVSSRRRSSRPRLGVPPAHPVMTKRATAPIVLSLHCETERMTEKDSPRDQ